MQTASFFKLFTIMVFLMNTSCSYANPIQNNAKQVLAQQSLDINEIQPYFHIDKFPERAPLIVVDNIHVKGIKLAKFNHDVVFMDKKIIMKEQRPYLEFSQLKINGNSASVSFVYPPESIAVQLTFRKSDHDWGLVDSKVVER